MKKPTDVNIHPYYGYTHDMVAGVEDLRTTLSMAVELEKCVRGHARRIQHPHFVTDTMGGGGKRDVHSYDHYDRASGIAVFTSPAVKPGKKFLYFDPIASLDEHACWRWTQPRERRAMIDDALESVPA